MNEINIACFIALATTKNITSTATMLSLTKGAVLQNIRRLETDLGIELFFSTAPRVQLTEAGEQFYTLFHSFETELIETSVSPGAYGQEQFLRLSISEYVGCPPAIAKTVQAFGQTHPDIRLFVSSETPVRCPELMLDGSADLILTTRYALPSEAKEEVLCELPLYLWSREDSAPQYYCDCPAASGDSGAAALMEQCGINLQIRQLPNPDSVNLAVRQGQGVTIAPMNDKLSRIPGLTAAKLERTATVCLVHSVQDCAPAAALLSQEIIRAAKEELR